MISKYDGRHDNHTSAPIFSFFITQQMNDVVVTVSLTSGVSMERIPNNVSSSLLMVPECAEAYLAWRRQFVTITEAKILLICPESTPCDVSPPTYRY